MSMNIRTVMRKNVEAGVRGDEWRFRGERGMFTTCLKAFLSVDGSRDSGK